MKSLRLLLACAAFILAFAAHQSRAQSSDDFLPWFDEKPAEVSRSSPSPSEPETPFIPVEALVGRWSAGEGEKAFSFVILPQQGMLGGKKSLEAHTDRRVWKGHYVDNPAEALVAEFFYSPRADEMDPAIPEWARAKFDGDVEWNLKLFARGPEHHPYLDAEWHRKKIRWDDARKSAELVEEDDEPLKFTLAYAPLLQMTQPAPVSIGIFSVRPRDEMYKSSGQLSSVLQQQHFMVELSAPFHALEKLGRTINVEFKGETSGKKAGLTLEARVPPGDVGKRVVYVNDKPVQLGDCTGEARYDPPTMSIEWFYNLKAEGPCIPFDGVDGEIVRLSVGKSAEYRFQWWKNWMSASLAGQRTEIERRRIAYNAVLSDGRYDAAAKTFARDKITMIRNYDALMRSDRLLPQHKVAIGEIYLGGDGGLGSYATYSGQTYGYSVPSKGLLSFTNEDFQGVRDHTVEIRWPTFEPGPYVDALTVYSKYVSWLFGYGSNDGRLGTHAAEALPPDRKDFNGNDIVPVANDKVDADLARDIVWAHPLERLGVTLAISSISSGRINEISESFFKQGAILMLDGMADESGAGFVYIFADWLVENAPAIMQGLGEGKWPEFSGMRDYKGQPIDGWGIAQTASSFVINFAPEIGQVTKYFTPKHFWVPDGLKSTSTDVYSWRTKIGAPEKAEQLYTVSKKSGVGESVVKKGDSLAEELPKSVPAEARAQVVVSYKPAALEPEKFVDLPAGPNPDKAEVVIPLAQAAQARMPYTPVIPPAGAVSAEYGAGAKLLGSAGSVMPVQQAKHTDGLIAANYIIGRQTGFVRDEATGSLIIQEVLQEAAAENKISPESIFYFGHGGAYPDAVLNEYLAGHGIQVVDHRGGNLTARLIDARVANENGWMVTARIGRGPSSKTVVIDEVVLGANGVPEKVRFFDPAYGAMVEVDAATFNAKLDRAGENSVFRAMRINQPDVLPAGGAKAVEDAASAVEAVAEVTPGLPDVSKATNLPTPNKLFKYENKNDPGNFLVVGLGEKLGQGSFSQVYRHADDPNIVVRINNPYGTGSGKHVVTFEDIDIAKRMDDLGREGLEEAWPLSKNFEMLPVYGVTEMPDGRRVELVGIARGESASSVLKKRARASLDADELRTIETYESTLEAGTKPAKELEEARKPLLKKMALAERYTPEEARVIAQTLHDLNEKGYVALDMHNGNFNLLRVDGKLKVEIMDPGGILPVKGRDPAAARRAQEAVVLRSDADIEFYRKHTDLYGWYDDRIEIMKKIEGDLDFDVIEIDPDLIPFKPAMGIVNPEIGEIFKTL